MIQRNDPDVIFPLLLDKLLEAIMHQQVQKQTSREDPSTEKHTTENRPIYPADGDLDLRNDFPSAQISRACHLWERNAVPFDAIQTEFGSADIQSSLTHLDS